MFKIITVDKKYKNNSVLKNNSFLRQRYKNVPFQRGKKTPLQSFDSSNPKVSIITVTYNAENEIENAISSVKNQTYKNIEYIIVDGGSQDQTVAKIKKHLDCIDLFLSEPDLGIYDAMNKGISNASGEYIVLLNADDELYAYFVEVSLSHLLSTNALISYCNYRTEENSIECPTLDVGLLLTQLDIKHNTFLMHKKCFDIVGLFDISLHVVSDAKWNRRAFLSGISFVKVDEELVFYSTTGKSSSQTAEMKEIIIDEASTLLRVVFSFLDYSEARALYTSNFNNHSLQNICRMIDRYGKNRPDFIEALKSFILFNFKRKKSYAVKSDNFGKIKDSIDICNKLGIDLDLCVKSNNDWMSQLLQQLSELKMKLADNECEPVLHFARRFSVPSESFIHNFLTELDGRKKNQLHIMLCDERLLPDERPYKWVLNVPWENQKDRIRQYIYQLIWKTINPKIVVAHFALNGFWLYERMKDKISSVPLILMCHGIDVFSIEPNTEYYRFIHEYAILSQKVRFTAVSGYLENELLIRGVPKGRIFNVHNTIPDKFFQARKKGNFFNGDRPLNILCVGRLIKWKGHDVLLHALKILVDSKVLKHGFRLEIVFGSWDEELQNLKKICGQYSMSEMVDFVEFVDFQACPEYYSKFDLFVLPSTFSDETTPKTETFGVALLEAISAGLAVITTDAGGLPEVIGNDNVAEATIVKHGSVESLASALKQVVVNCKKVFKNNEHYARDRLASFSEDARIEKWDKVVRDITQERKTIYHFCALARGGASNATVNYHKALLRSGVNSIFVSRSSEKKRFPKFFPDVIYLDSQASFDFEHAQSANRIKFNHTIFSIDDEPITNEILRDIVSDADVINLTWHAQFLSSSNISMLTNLGIPVFMTIRDMHPLTGGCHYFHGCSNWQRDCDACPQIQDNKDNYPSLVLKNKLSNWNMKNLTVICISKHTTGIIKKSPLLSHAHRVKVVHNICDHRKFKVLNRQAVREMFEINDPDYVIGYLPSFASEVKGHDLFIKTLKRYLETSPVRNTVILTAGATIKENLPFSTINLGQIDDMSLLNQFYNACDVVVVPSREETFSNTVVEALSCGTPVVGFRTGIMEELTRHPLFGTFVEIGNVENLVMGLRRWATAIIDNREKRSKEIRKMFNEEQQVGLFLNLTDLAIRDCSKLHLPKSNDCKTDKMSIAEQLNSRMIIRKAQGARSRLSGINQKLIALQDNLRKRSN